MMLRLWKIAKIVFLAFVVGALFYAVVHAADFKLPEELSFLSEAEVIQVFGCEKKETGEKAVCVILATEETSYLLAIDPETTRVKEAYKKEGDQVRKIYGQVALKPT